MLFATGSIIWYALNEQYVESGSYSKRGVRQLAGRPYEAHSPFVLWFTGLSGSGKSTIADQVYADLKDRYVKVERLDGDEIRSVFPDTGFDRAGRMAHIARVGYLASVLERNGISTIVSLISPYREARDGVRELCRRFIEVHVSTPLDVCEARDVKGLYAKSRRGEIEGFTGIDDPYEEPERPELLIDTSRQTVGESVAAVMQHIEPYV